MSQVGDKFVCDGCGRDLDNGSLANCVVISALDLETGLAYTLHLCLDYEVDDKTVRGCAGKTLTAARLADYLERKGRQDAAAGAN